MNNDLISRKELRKAFKECPFFTEVYLYYARHLIDNAMTVPLPNFKEGYKQAIIDGKTNFSRPQGEWYFSCEKGWEQR